MTKPETSMTYEEISQSEALSANPNPNSDVVRREKNSWILVRIFRPLWQDITTLARYLRVYWKEGIFHIGTPLVLAIAGAYSFAFAIAESDELQYCSPGGDFTFDTTYNPWSAEHAFQITLGFGALSFTQAKVIDVAWDVVVGRGGQLLLSTICFLVFTKCLNRILEEPQKSVSYNFYRALVFEAPGLSSITMIGQELRSQRNWRVFASIIWIILASAYVIVFPTLTSAMTGYIPTVTPYFRDGTNKVQVSPSLFHRALYSVRDADRIEGLNLSSPYVVGSEPLSVGSNSATVEDEYYRCLSDIDIMNRFINYSYPLRGCALAYAFSQYVESYGGSVPQNRVSVLEYRNTTYQISAPTLDIKVLNTSSRKEMYVQAPLSMNGIQNDNTKNTLMYTTTNSTVWYSATQIADAGSCDNELTYQWGFSFILLFVFYVLTFVWILGMYAMWEDSFWSSRLDRARRHLGFYRGIADVSNAMWKDMLREPTELSSDSDIKRMLSHRRNGGRIAYDELVHDGLPQPRCKQLKEENMPALLSGWTKPWKAAHWSWLFIAVVISFACMGFAAIAILNAQGSELIFYYGLGFYGIWGLFLLVVLAMIVTGLGCTLGRWGRATVLRVSLSKSTYMQGLTNGTLLEH